MGSHLKVDQEPEQQVGKCLNPLSTVQTPLAPW